MDISYNTDSAAPGGPGSWTVPTLDIELDGGIWAFPGGFDAGISSTITLENEGHGILFDYQRTDLDALGNHDEIEVFLHGGKAWTTLPTDFSGTYGNYWLDYGGGIGQPHWILNGPVTTVPEPSGLVLVLSAMILVTPVILKRSQVD